MLRAQFDEHKSGIDLGSNLSGTPPKLYFIQYFEKKRYKPYGAFLLHFVKAEYKKWCTSAKYKWTVHSCVSE